MKTLRKLLRAPVRLDRSIEAPWENGPVFDLDVIHRGFKESLLAARLFRHPPRYVRARTRAPR